MIMNVTKMMIEKKVGYCLVKYSGIIYKKLVHHAIRRYKYSKRIN